MEVSNQDGFASLFARLAESKGNANAGVGAVRTPAAPKPKPERSEKPEKSNKNNKGGKNKRRAAEEDSVDDGVDSVMNEEDLPLASLYSSPQNGQEGQPPKKPRNSNDGKKATATPPMSTSRKLFPVEDDDDLTQDDKQTLERFTALVSEMKDLRAAPVGPEDGQFIQWIKDCGPSIFSFFKFFPKSLIFKL